MFETFEHNSNRESGKTPSCRAQLENEGFRPWLWRTFSWPLQRMRFRSQVGTPRELTAFEKILLLVYVTMREKPPHPDAVATELHIGDTFFVEQILQDLADLGAIEWRPNTAARITDMGWECQRRGQIPSQRREKIFPIVFDPVTGEFPDIQIELPDSVPSNPKPPADAIVSQFYPADPRRVDLESVQSAAAAQKVTAAEHGSVIFTAKPVSRVNNDSQKTCQAKSESPEIHWQDVRLIMLINDQGAMALDIEAPSVLRDWLRRAISRPKVLKQINCRKMLGTLEIPTVPKEESEDIHNENKTIHWVAATHVHDEILSAINKARNELTMQCRHTTGNPAGELTKAVLRAAGRGVQCRLLWDTPDPSDTHSKLSERFAHDNLEIRISPVDRELLIVDGKLLMASSVFRIQLPFIEQSLPVLRMWISKDSKICGEYRQVLESAWSQATPLKGQVHEEVSIPIAETEYVVEGKRASRHSYDELEAVSAAYYTEEMEE